MINKHNLKMRGLKKASGETMDYGTYSDKYDELFYDRSTGEIWTRFQCSIGQNAWTCYHDPDVVKICNTQHHMTMQEIADAIRDTLRELDGELYQSAPELRRYKIEYNHNGRDVVAVRTACNAADAAEKLCDQYGWSMCVRQVDADSRGLDWAECAADTDGGINHTMRIISAAQA